MAGWNDIVYLGRIMLWHYYLTFVTNGGDWSCLGNLDISWLYFRLIRDHTLTDGQETSKGLQTRSSDFHSFAECTEKTTIIQLISIQKAACLLIPTLSCEQKIRESAIHVCHYLRSLSSAWLSFVAICFSLASDRTNE